MYQSILGLGLNVIASQLPHIIAFQSKPGVKISQHCLCAIRYNLQLAIQLNI